MAPRRWHIAASVLVVGAHSLYYAAAQAAAIVRRDAPVAPHGDVALVTSDGIVLLGGNAKKVTSRLAPLQPLVRAVASVESEGASEAVSPDQGSTSSSSAGVYEDDFPITDKHIGQMPASFLSSSHSAVDPNQQSTEFLPLVDYVALQPAINKLSCEWIVFARFSGVFCLFVLVLVAGFQMQGTTVYGAMGTENNVWWLGLLFGATLCLVSLQGTLGWLTRSVTLLAESAHSGADVIVYGLNLLVERLKLSQERGQNGATAASAANAGLFLDTCGSVASLFIMLSATYFATSEALHRLRTPSGGKASAGNIGPAMLGSSIASATVTIGMLTMYRRWQRLEPKAQAQLPSTPATVETTTGTPIDFGQVQQTVNTIPDYSKMTAEDIRASPVCLPCCSPPISSECERVAEGRSSKTAQVVSRLHMIVHPGCRGHGVCLPEPPVVRAGEADGLKQEAVARSSKLRNNLNLIAAFLHLMSDFLRSLLVLATAFLIQLGWAHDPERADALCGLAAGLLILVGSLTLCLRVLARLQACWCSSEAEIGTLESTPGIPPEPKAK